ncbi:LolA family protein [Anaeromyxobacter paludicola]|uniref:Outer membrane lipoprotein carrier protein LolA n=1 Tax=Anaeromyxobacter paludicola TaxID=2918171 RepID=A0ABM7XD28_9BACT|nr:outer membrane lipoprotein carrier protein LolA [Anaeromyxobacter paludicola]BDG09784.1 hypothetical protein AMPC_28970 [Anaeromyxobacter paludicola]
MQTTLLLCALAAAPAPEAQQLAAKVQAAYERTRDLEARFVQTYTYAAFGRSQVSRGTLEVKKPGKMRWDYQEPAHKTVVVNGSRLVQYEPEVNQAYVDDHFDATAMSAAVTFLLGKGSLEKEFEPSIGERGELVLVPRRPDGRVARIALGVDAAGDVTSTRVVDEGGNVNEVRFEGARRNVGLKDSRFELKLPADVRRVAAPGR